MPSFILRDIDDKLWRRVKAKAAAEGVTIKALILRLLGRWVDPSLSWVDDAAAEIYHGADTSVGTIAEVIARHHRGVILIIVALALLASACTSPYEPTPLPANPIVVTPPPPTTNPGPTETPLSVSLSTGRGNPAVGDRMSFVASVGATITTAAWSFGNGATATTSSADTVYAYPSAGTFTASVAVTASDGRTGSASARVTVSPPRPGQPPPPPTPPPAPPVLTIDLTCAAKPALTPTPCNVTASYGGVVQPSSQTTSVSWDFGDGPPPVATAGPVVSHVYPQAGSYTVFATATVQTVDGVKMATASKTLLVP